MPYLLVGTPLVLVLFIVGCPAFLAFVVRSRRRAGRTSLDRDNKVKLATDFGTSIPIVALPWNILNYGVNKMGQGPRLLLRRFLSAFQMRLKQPRVRQP